MKIYLHTIKITLYSIKYIFIISSFCHDIEINFYQIKVNLYPVKKKFIIYIFFSSYFFHIYLFFIEYFFGEHIWSSICIYKIQDLTFSM